MDIPTTLGVSATAFEPCPKCGEPRPVGMHHVECRTADVPGVYEIRQSFSWSNEDNTRSIDFDVTAMLHAMKRSDLVFVRIQSVLDEVFARDWLPLRDLRYDYVRALSRERIDEPVLGVDMGDETTLLIDGSHRYWARYARGLKTLHWHIVPYPLWKPFAQETTRGRSVK